MGTGLKKNCSAPLHGTSWIDYFNISNATAIAGLKNVMIVSGDNRDVVIAWWDSATALTTSWLANFPKGSIVIDLETTNIRVKTAAAGTDTWEAAAVS